MGGMPFVVPFQYGVPQRCGAATYEQSMAAHQRRRLKDRGLWPDSQIRNDGPMQALENVTAAGIFDVEHAHQPGTRTWGNHKPS